MYALNGGGGFGGGEWVYGADAGGPGADLPGAPTSSTSDSNGFTATGTGNSVAASTAGVLAQFSGAVIPAELAAPGGWWALVVLVVVGFIAYQAARGSR